jgi:hypothetical protein
MMNREQRKRDIRERNERFIPESVDPFSEEAFRQVCEEEERSSERRFDVLNSREAVETITRAANSFREARGFEVTVTYSAENIPDMPRDACFKYTRQWGEGSLPACSQRINNGEKVTMALVCEEGLLIGYGIAVTRCAESEIEIIDVDYYSRREADLKETVQFGGQSFAVGVGHVVVLALMQACPRPVKVDATTPHSSYVFKSLGFVHDDRSGNPGILRME